MHGQAERASLRCWCRQPRGKGAAGAGERGRQVGEVERVWGRSAWRDRNSKRETPREWERQTGGERRDRATQRGAQAGTGTRTGDKEQTQEAREQGVMGTQGHELTGGGGDRELEGDAAAPQRESSPPPPSCVPVASSWCRKVPSAPAAGACRSVPPPRLLRSRCPWHGLFPSKGGFLG